MTRINRNPIYYPQTQSPQSLKLYSQNKQTNKRKFDKKNFKNPAIEYEQVNKETCFSFENEFKFQIILLTWGGFADDMEKFRGNLGRGKENKT